MGIKVFFFQTQKSSARRLSRRICTEFIGARRRHLANDDIQDTQAGDGGRDQEEDPQVTTATLLEVPQLIQLFHRKQGINRLNEYYSQKNPSKCFLEFFVHFKDFSRFFLFPVSFFFLLVWQQINEIEQEV